MEQTKKLNMTAMSEKTNSNTTTKKEEPCLLYTSEGLAQNYTGQVFADYASGSLDEAGFVKTLEQVIQGAYAN